MNMLRRFALFIFLIACFISAAHAARPHAGAIVVVEVRVAAETRVHSDRITLGDIAEVRSNDSATTERLRAIALGYAPNVAAVREITRERISLALAAAGFASNQVSLESPSIALIKRAAQIVDPALVREAVENSTLAELRFVGATARLARLDLPPVIEVVAGTLQARALVAGVRNVFAPFIVAIELRVDDQVVQRLSVTAQVEAFAPVLVAAHDLAPNTRLRVEDTIIEPRRLEHPLSFYIRDAGQLHGVSMRHALARGEVVSVETIVAELVIKPGDPVRITGESGAFHVAVMGEARASGHVGDRIQVKNTQSGALLQAIIVDEGVVRVRY